MRNPKKLLATISAVLCAAVMLGVAPPAEAQVRAALVRDMDSAVRGTRFFHSFPSINFNTGSFFESATLTPTIPAGKKLFLKSVSTHVLLTDGQSVMRAGIDVRNGGNIEAKFYIAQVFQAAPLGSANPQRHFTGNQELNVMVNPGDTVNLDFFRNDNLGSDGLNFANVELMGYLVDAIP